MLAQLQPSVLINDGLLISPRVVVRHHHTHAFALDPRPYVDIPFILLIACYKVLDTQLHTKFLQQFLFSPLRNFQSHVIFRYLLKKGRLIAANRNTYRTNAMPAARRLGLHVGVV